MNRKTNKQVLLEREIERVYDYLSKLPPKSDEYQLTMTRLKDLETIYENNVLATKISGKDVLHATTTLLGVGVIVGYEANHALCSKAIGVVTKRL